MPRVGDEVLGHHAPHTQPLNHCTVVPVCTVSVLI